MAVNPLYLLSLVCLRRVLISANTYPLKQIENTLKYVTKSLFLLCPRKPREQIAKLHFSRGIHARRTSSDHAHYFRNSPQNEDCFFL